MVNESYIHEKAHELFLEQRRKHRLRQYHFSFVFKKSRLVLIAPNVPHNHPKISKYDFRPTVDTLHAELNACIKLGIEDCSDYSMVVVRIAKGSGKLVNSRPCSGCQDAMRQLGFRRVYFSNQEGKIEKLW